MSIEVTISHSFEAAHRLPPLEGKCQNLHGHSWQLEVTVEAPQGFGGPERPEVVVEFAELKRQVRAWVDEHLDHGAMLGESDSLLEPLLSEGSKVYIFGEAEGYWPSVEAVARLIAQKVDEMLLHIDAAPGACVSRVKVSETSTNSATWRGGRL